jgi:hypothetical protein
MERKIVFSTLLCGMRLYLFVPCWCAHLSVLWYWYTSVFHSEFAPFAFPVKFSLHHQSSMLLSVALAAGGSLLVPTPPALVVPAPAAAIAHQSMATVTPPDSPIFPSSLLVADFDMSSMLDELPESLDSSSNAGSKGEASTADKVADLRARQEKADEAARRKYEDLLRVEELMEKQKAMKGASDGERPDCPWCGR